MWGRDKTVQVLMIFELRNCKQKNKKSFIKFFFVHQLTSATQHHTKEMYLNCSFQANLIPDLISCECSPMKPKKDVSNIFRSLPPLSCLLTNAVDIKQRQLSLATETAKSSLILMDQVMSNLLIPFHHSCMKFMI